MSDDCEFIFNALDRNAEVKLAERNLPHWFQSGAAIFVTFRTRDSLPRDVLLRMRRELLQWLTARGLPPELAESSLDIRWPVDDALLQSVGRRDRTEFRRLVNRCYQWSLDNCHGQCVLRQPQLSRIVRDALLHDHQSKYDLDCFVIMPNHVHAIVQFRSGFDLAVIGQSWMRYSARQINSVTGASGGFWQPEPFDHIIRSSEQFVWLQQYIAQNPEKARLGAGEYVLWQRD